MSFLEHYFRSGVSKLFLARPHSGLSTVQCDPMSVYLCEFMRARPCVNYLYQGGPTSALLWATFQNYSNFRASTG